MASNKRPSDAMSEDERELIRRCIAPLAERLKAELGSKLEELDREWQQQYGEPYPQNLDAWIRWGHRVGWDGEFVRWGEWTAAEVMPAIEGHLLRLRDRVQQAENERNQPSREPPSAQGSVDDRMWVKLRADGIDGESWDWTVRQWKEHLNCSPAAIHRTIAWSAIMARRKQRAAERHERDRRKGEWEGNR